MASSLNKTQRLHGDRLHRKIAKWQKATKDADRPSKDEIAPSLKTVESPGAFDFASDAGEEEVAHRSVSEVDAAEFQRERAAAAAVGGAMSFQGNHTMGPRYPRFGDVRTLPHLR